MFQIISWQIVSLELWQFWSLPYLPLIHIYIPTYSVRLIIISVEYVTIVFVRRLDTQYTYKYDWNEFHIFSHKTIRYKSVATMNSKHLNDCLVAFEHIHFHLHGKRWWRGTALMFATIQDSNLDFAYRFTVCMLCSWSWIICAYLRIRPYGMYMSNVCVCIRCMVCV